VVRWAEAVTLNQAKEDDEAFEALRQHFDEDAIVELTVVAAWRNFMNRLVDALHVDLEPVERQPARHRIQADQDALRAYVAELLGWM
jgi:hypothetical protein